jgi:hypothetical protein
VARACPSFGQRKGRRQASQLKGNMNGMSLCYKSTYRYALDRISKLLDETLRRIG